MRKSLWIMLALVVVGGAQVAHADGLLGTSVTGSVFFNGGGDNFFDPANGNVPAGFGNSSGTTVTIVDPGVEFGLNDGANLDTADLANTTLLISDTCEANECAGNVSFMMTFTDTAFTGLTLAKISDSFVNGGLTGSLVGDTLTITWAGGGGDSFPNGTTDSGEFSLTSATSVPEPSSVALMLLGVGLVFVMRKRIGQRLPQAS